jgi:flagellar biosynthesis chaperone FliJ
MPVSRSLRRLLRIRDIEEEQCRLALESALSEFNRLEHAMADTAEQDRRGRRLVASGVCGGELLDRLAGLEEMHAASRLASALAPKIAESAQDVVTLRQEFLSKRVERRQAETLIGETEARDAVATGRREQQGIDDWYRSRMRLAETGTRSSTVGSTDRDDECAARRT